MKISAVSHIWGIISTLAAYPRGAATCRAVRACMLFFFFKHSLSLLPTVSTPPCFWRRLVIRCQDKEPGRKTAGSQTVFLVGSTRVLTTYWWVFLLFCHIFTQETSQQLSLLLVMLWALELKHKETQGLAVQILFQRRRLESIFHMCRHTTKVFIKI